ncbi:CPBP family intramembrane glutamic endopeptidase [Streptosporangium sp. NBC_01469]|uniref:CPBP family intramembrane glutamic endopeptidase n=1 Tax=Streptosporangium sp. NBC_01469 TaxID=2903898 RepID=UPI002E2AE060|nr:CPBP family intramembrane glutamic endopeptidase [Streptosporangium sp. NBC_01469]
MYSNSPISGPGSLPPGTAPIVPHGTSPHRHGTRPIPPDVPYHLVLAGEKRRVGRGVLALVLLLVGLFGFGGVLTALGSAIDQSLGRVNPIAGGTEFTPIFHAANLISIALMIPWSMFVQRRLYGVKGASLHSVLSAFRPAVFGRAVLTLVPIWVLYMTAFFLLAPYTEGSWRFSDLVALFVITLLLAPLQSAGEEYGYRGLAFRVAASWGRGPRTALVLGLAVSSILFAAIHLSTDPWLNVYYLTLGVTFGLITWRTGGLETSIVIHAANNALAYLLMIVTHADPLAGSDRSAGTGSAVFLMPCVLLVAITAVIWARTRRTGPPLTPQSSPPAR